MFYRKKEKEKESMNKGWQVLMPFLLISNIILIAFSFYTINHLAKKKYFFIKKHIRKKENLEQKITFF
jgi:hypothetical protein